MGSVAPRHAAVGYNVKASMKILREVGLLPFVEFFGTGSLY
ncbi:ANK-REP-REGION domain-containing protein [Pseudomonas yamanorum]|jgi:hypothetical protein|nr:hypothetical protein SAMN05216237_1991 [Pseudomonas yamanorum]